jgi:hypothetical protein
MTCLQKDIARRYASAQELGTDLHAFIEGKTSITLAGHDESKRDQWGGDSDDSAADAVSRRESFHKRLMKTGGLVLLASILWILGTFEQSLAPSGPMPATSVLPVGIVQCVVGVLILSAGVGRRGPTGVGIIAAVGIFLAGFQLYCNAAIAFAPSRSSATWRLPNMGAMIAIVLCLVAYIKVALGVIASR